MFARLIFSFILIFSVQPAKAELTTEALNFFLQESSVKYVLRDPEQPDVALFEVAETTTNVAKFLPAFADRLNLDQDVAALWAEALIEAVRVSEECDNSQSYEECRLDRDDALIQALAGIAMQDADGALATALIKPVTGYSDPEAFNAALVQEVIAEHPAYDRIVSALFTYRPSIEWQIALLAKGSQNEALHQDMLGRWHYIRQSPDNINGRLAALFEMAAVIAQEKGQFRNALFARQALMKTMLSNGMGKAALDMFDGLAPEARRMFFTEPRDITQLRRRRAVMEAVYDLGVNLVAARVLEDGSQSDTARALFAEVRAMEDAALTPSPHALVLQDIFYAQYGPNDIYDLYLYGVRAEPDRAAYQIVEELTVENIKSRPTGWRSALASAGPELSWIASDRLDQVGLADIAAKTRADLPLHDWQDWHRPGVTQMENRLFSQSYADRKSHWETAIREARNMWQQRRDAAAEPGHEAASFVVQRPLQHAFTETGGSAPEGQICPREEPDAIADWPEDAPVDISQAVRYEKSGDTRAIVFLSGEYERPGELPGWGYFVQFDHGKGWERPMFLGLQHHFPYVLRQISALAMLGQEGRLILEADLEEINMDNLVFPPFGLGLSRHRCGVILDFSLDAIAKDSDGDWMTDLAEARLGMDPNSNDTDGDGIADGFDTLPLTPFDANSPAKNTELALSLLAAMMGTERQAIMVTQDPGDNAEASIGLPGEGVLPALDTQFILADPKLFTGLALPFRLFVYDKSDLRKLNRGKAPFFPPEVSGMFHRPDGSEIYVIWSAQWTGGSFLIRCDTAQSCQMIMHEFWIT